MSRTEFFPYPVAEGALKIRYEFKSDQLEDVDHGRILAVEVPEPEPVRLDLTVEVAEGTYDKVLPEPERAEPPVDLVIALRSVSARERKTVEMVPDDGCWRGTLDIPKSELYGEVDLEPILIRNRPGSDDGYAAHRGAMIATGETVKVLVDEPPLPVGGFIEIKFESFRESGNRKRSEKPKLLYMLDTDRETPIIWLNEDIPEFKNVMLARGPRGGNLRVRDAMFDTVVSQVWTSLASVALTNLALALHEGEDDDADRLASLPEWHQRVISFWAPTLYPGSRAEAIESVIDTASDRRLLPELFDRLSVAVQEQARTGRAFQGLIRLRDREGV
jgi:hypothetical protein